MHSYWENDTYYAPADIIIIGGGLMGLWTALELKKRAPSLSITILEKNTTPTGASTRNAGFACFGSISELLSDEKSMGADAMLQLVEQRFKGIKKLQSVLSDDAIDFNPCGGYEVFTKEQPVLHKIEENLLRINALLQPITGTYHTFSIVEKGLGFTGLKSFDKLVENKLEGSLHSGKLVNALTKLAISKGVSFMFGVEVTHFVETQFVTVHTKNNGALKAGNVVCCTNGYTHTLFPELGVVPARGQIILTKPIPKLKTVGTYHYKEGYYYWRNLGDRILLGGARNTALEEEQTTDLNGSDTIRNTLLAFLKEHLDTHSPIEIEQSWSGIMGFTPDKKPMCKKLSPLVTAVIACNGIGVALTPIMAETVADAVLL